MDDRTTLEGAKAELSSVGAQIDEITRRILAAAEHFDKQQDDNVSHELFEVERALRTAGRRLGRVNQSLR